MISSELHPFEPFVPLNSRILILGSFPGREQTQNKVGKDDWFYGAPRNQFWKILECAFETELSTKSEKQLLFSQQGIAITDLFLEINRSAASNGDEHLHIVHYNTSAISQILIQFPDIQVLCTSRFVEKEFRKLFPGKQLVSSLPSPSPRYARIGINEKTAVYKQLLTAKFD